MIKTDTENIKDWPEGVVMGSAEIQSDWPSDLLTPNELKEFASFTNKKRKAEFLSARYLFRFLLSEIGLEPKSIELLKMKSGKPFARQGNKTLYVSFSHTTEMVFCSISAEYNIGLDAELNQRKVKQELIKRILNDREELLLNEADPIQLWTIKEAVVKCMGTGLRTNLKDLTIQKREKNQYFVIFNNDKSFEICSFSQSSHRIALAYQGNTF